MNRIGYKRKGVVSEYSELVVLEVYKAYLTLCSQTDTNTDCSAMSGDESTASRRSFLGVTAVGLVGISGRDIINQIRQTDSNEETEAPLGLTQPDEAQANGGSMNQSYRDAQYSAIGVENIWKIDDQEASYAPITNPDGITASIQYFDGEENGYITFTDIENQEVVNQLEVEPGPNMGMWNDGKFIYGTPQSTTEKTIDGKTTQRVPTGSDGGMAKQGGTAYIARPYGVAEAPINDITDITKHEFIGNPPMESLTVVDEGNTLAMFSYRNLVSHDTQKQETIADPSIPVSPPVSTDGDHLFVTDTENIKAYEIPKESGQEFNLVAAAPFSGTSFTPSVIADKDDETYIVDGSSDDIDGPFAVQAYSLKDGKLNQIWSTEVEGNLDSPTEQLVGVNNTIIAGADNLYGLDLETGEKLFEADIDGKPGMPHGKYLPVGTEDGTYILEMEVGEVPSQQEPTTTPEPTETSTPEPTTEPEPTPTETPEPTTTEPETTTSTPEPTTETTTPTTETSTGTPTDTPTDSPTAETDTTSSTSTPGNSTTSPESGTETASGDGPGFGLLSGLTALGGAGYLARNRFGRNEKEES
mgnify:CR=1 FL=1